MGDADLAGEADRECGEETFIMEREERAGEEDSGAVSWGGSGGKASGLRDIEGPPGEAGGRAGPRRLPRRPAGLGFSSNDASWSASAWVLASQRLER